MILSISPENVTGLTEYEASLLNKLLEVWQDHKGSNDIKDRYYEGHISLDEVNLGIALPDGMRKLEIGCSWGAKTVDVLAARSMFDGFVGSDGNEVDELAEIALKNRLIAEYTKSCRDELKFGCTFATLSADPKLRCKIRFHSPQTAAALWDGEKNRIGCGFAIIDTVEDESCMNAWIPSLMNLYTDRDVLVLRRDGNEWYAERHPHRMGRPLIEPLIWNATSSKPFGRSRIKEPVRRLIQGYVRTIANATIGLEFSTAPQKYLLGITDEQYEAVVNDKFKQYVGNILAGTTNPDTGEKPTFGQLQQGTIAPHVEMIRLLATQFSAATGLPVTDTGVINDANPTSSDAIEAQTKTLVGLAQDLNTGNGDALRNIAVMSLAIANNTTLDALTDDQRNVVAHFKNPAMPSVAATADAAIKIASARENFAQTDVFLEMIGMDQADIRRIKAQESRARGLSFFQDIGGSDADTEENMD
jgi:hypothetical protein